MSLKPLSSPLLRFGPQATRGCARHEGGDPFAPCPTTRGRFQRAHPRGRAWYRGGAGLCFVGRVYVRGRGGTGGGGRRGGLGRVPHHRSPDASAGLVRTHFDPPGSPDASAHSLYASSAHAGSSPLSALFGRSGPQAARGARHERGDPIEPHPTTRARLQCAHPRRRARPGMWSTLFVSICTARTLRSPF